MGNLTTVSFDLERLYTAMINTGVAPEKAITEYSEQEMQQLGHCYIAAYQEVELLPITATKPAHLAMEDELLLF